MHPLGPVASMDSNKQLVTMNREQAKWEAKPLQSSLIMRSDRCEKSVNQFTQKGKIIRTGADETGTFQASLVPSLFKFPLHRSIIRIIILL